MCVRSRCTRLVRRIAKWTARASITVVWELRREVVEHTEHDTKHAGAGLCEPMLYDFSHAAPDEHRGMVRTDGARQWIVPSSPQLRRPLQRDHIATHPPIGVRIAAIEETGTGGVTLANGYSSSCSSFIWMSPPKTSFTLRSRSFCARAGEPMPPTDALACSASS